MLLLFPDSNQSLLSKLPSNVNLEGHQREKRYLFPEASLSNSDIQKPVEEKICPLIQVIKLKIEYSPIKVKA